MFPAHAVPDLSLGGILDVGEAEFLFAEADEVRGEDDAAGVASPVVGIERGVILGEEGVASVAENRFDEIEITGHRTGGKKAHLHAFFRGETGNLGDDDGPEEERDVEVGWFGRGGSEGEDLKLLGGVHGCLKNIVGYVFRDGSLVLGNRETALDNVENALSGATVLLGVVEDPLRDPVAGGDGRFEGIGIWWQGEGAGNAMAIENEGRARQTEWVLISAEV